MSTPTARESRSFEDFVPQVRPGTIVRHFGHEAVVWSPQGPDPVFLEPLAALVLQICDGVSPIGALLADIHEIVGVPQAVARNQVMRIIATLDQGAVLVTSPVVVPPHETDLFRGPLSH